MSLAEVSKDAQHCTPDTNEESDDKQKSLPLGDLGIPQETPIPSIRLENQTVSVYQFLA